MKTDSARLSSVNFSTEQSRAVLPAQRPSCISILPMLCTAQQATQLACMPCHAVMDLSVRSIAPALNFNLYLHLYFYFYLYLYLTHTDQIRCHRILRICYLPFFTGNNRLELNWKEGRKEGFRSRKHTQSRPLKRKIKKFGDFFMSHNFVFLFCYICCYFYN